MRWILWLSLAAVLARGQDRIQIYTTDSGLPDNSILALLQSKDGYLWFTTYRGIVRFDGAHFQVFDTSNTPAIHGTTFAAFALMEDSHGDIWAGAWGAGALRYHDGEFHSYTVRDGLPGNSVTRINEDNEGAIWFYTAQGLGRFRNGKIERVNSIGGESLEPYLSKPAALGGDSALFGLWRIDRRRPLLQRFAHGKWQDVPLPAGLGNVSKLRMEVTAEDSRGRLWYRIFDRPRETFCVEDGRLTQYTALPEGSFATYRDRGGGLWITDRKGQASIWSNGRATRLSGISTPSPLRVVEDTQGGIWVGTLNQGLGHVPRPLVQTVRLPGGPEINTIQPILQDGKGDIWVGSSGLTRIHGGQFQTFRLPLWMAPWPTDQRVFSLWADPDGIVYFSNGSRVSIFKAGTILPAENPLDQIKERVNAIIRDHLGNLWLGAGEQIYKVQAGRLEEIKPKGGLPLRGEVRSLAEDRSGAVWVGTDAVLCRYRDGELKCFGDADALTNWRIRSITADAQGVVWASSADRGILRIAGDSFRWIQRKDGLYSNDAAAMLEDSRGYFWIGGRTGIYRVRKEELNAFARGAIDHVTSSYFGKNDGLSATNTAGFGEPDGFVARDGAIWFPTTGGLAKLDPAEIAPDNSPPRVEFESCSVEQKPVACAPELSLPPDAEDVHIDYTAVSLERSGQIQFRYRLAPLDTKWVNAGDRRTAYYPHLPPGSYRFQVMAASSFGVWTKEPSELAVRVKAHYYQTGWFRALAGAAIIGLFFAMWQIKAIEYRQRQAAQRAFAQQIIASQENERKRIARELHDSLGQHLTIIKNVAVLLQRDGKDGERRLAAIADETTQAIVEVRQISRNLRPYQLDLCGLTNAIERLTETVCEAAHIRAEIAIADLEGAFPKDVEIHFYRIVQECLNNAVKHAQATMISVRAERRPAGVTLTVSDDGVGFAGGRPPGESTPGFGLTGISERAQFLGGTSVVRSAPGLGTTVFVEIPLRPAEPKPDQV